YTEDEIEYLTDTIRAESPVVADFGSIPHSAAWFTGLQRSTIRIMVAHPNHELQLQRLMRLSMDLGIEPEHWFLVGNQITSDDLPIHSLAQSLGMQTLPLSSLPYKERSTPFF